jgi:hypothetical protein
MKEIHLIYVRGFPVDNPHGFEGYCFIKVSRRRLSACLAVRL